MYAGIFEERKLKNPPMNFIFVSPHFPKTYWNFCERLHRNGVNVLGIGDAPFDEIPGSSKHCLTEYYRVNDLGNYDEMLRAVAYSPSITVRSTGWNQQRILAGNGCPDANRL